MKTALCFGGPRFNTGEECCMRDVRAGRTYGDLNLSVALCSGTVEFPEVVLHRYTSMKVKCTGQRSAGRHHSSARNTRRRQVLAPTVHFIRKSKLYPNCHMN